MTYISYYPGSLFTFCLRSPLSLNSPSNVGPFIVGSMEGPSKAFLLFSLLPDWLKLNHLKSRMECGFSYNLLRHICSTVAETTGVTNYAASFGAKKWSENHI